MGQGQGLGAIADGKLDGEVDAQPHEQGKEGHGHQGEPLEHQKTEACGEGQAGQHGHGDGQDHPGRPDAPEQHPAHQGQAESGDGTGGFRQVVEFVRFHGHGAGGLDVRIRPMAAGQADLLLRLQDRVQGRARRFDQVEVELRGQGHDPAPIPRRRLLAGHQLPPGQGRGAAGRGVGEGPVQGPQHGGQPVEACGVLLGIGEARLHGPGQAAQAGIGGNRTDQGLGRDQLGGALADLVHRLEQQGLLLQPRTAIGALDHGEHIGALGQAVRQLVGDVIGQLRRGAIHHQGEVLSLADKGGFERGLRPSPGQVSGDQGIEVSADAEMSHEVGEAEGGDHQGRGEGEPRTGQGHPDQALRQDSQHRLCHAAGPGGSGVGCGRAGEASGTDTGGAATEGGAASGALRRSGSSGAPGMSPRTWDCRVWR